MDSLNAWVNIQFSDTVFSRSVCSSILVWCVFYLSCERSRNHSNLCLSHFPSPYFYSRMTPVDYLVRVTKSQLSGKLSFFPHKTLLSRAQTHFAEIRQSTLKVGGVDKKNKFLIKVSNCNKTIASIKSPKNNWIVNCFTDLYRLLAIFPGQQQQHKSASHNGKTKEPCPFCKEQKKRPLVAYIRKRDNKKNSESICEEEEEEVEKTKQKWNESLITPLFSLNLSFSWWRWHCLVYLMLIILTNLFSGLWHLFFVLK